MSATIILNGLCSEKKLTTTTELVMLMWYGEAANICVHGDNFIEIKIKLLYNCMKICL